ncbi:hypothetical protein ES705_22474 [subsurface metagenome]
MEYLGKTALLVIEPLGFDFKLQEVFYPNFGFVLTSESEFFRNKAAEFCLEYHKIRQESFGPKILTRVRKSMKEYLSKTVKSEREFLELLAMFFDIAYFTAMSRKKQFHFRKFVIIEECEPRYFLYLGSMDFTSLEVLERIQEIVESSKIGNAPMSYFEFIQLIN